MAIHSPACDAFLAELSTAPPDSIEFRMSSVVGRLPETKARGYLPTVLDEDAGSYAADLARDIWRHATEPTAIEEQR